MGQMKQFLFNWIESNHESLANRFIEQEKDHFHDFCDTHDSAQEDFIEKESDRFDEFCWGLADQEAMADACDEAYDRMKDDQMMASYEESQAGEPMQSVEIEIDEQEDSGTQCGSRGVQTPVVKSE